MGRRVPETKVLGKVQLADERLGTLQDNSKTAGDIDDLKLVATVIALAGFVEQLELISEKLQKGLVASKYLCCS